MGWNGSPVRTNTRDYTVLCEVTLKAESGRQFPLELNLNLINALPGESFKEYYNATVCFEGIIEVLLACIVSWSSVVSGPQTGIGIHLNASRLP